MVRYRAKMSYSPNTIEELSVVRYNTFHMRLRYVCCLVGLVCFVLALTHALGEGLTFPLLAVGAGGLGLNGAQPKQDAKRVKRSFRGYYPVARYEFCDEDMQITSGANAPERSEYKDICLLVEDKEYVYLFLRDRSAYMVDRSTLAPQDWDSFRSFLAKRTKLRWTRRQRFLRTSWKELQSNRLAGRF